MWQPCECINGNTYLSRNNSKLPRLYPSPHFWKITSHFLFCFALISLSFFISAGFWISWCPNIPLFILCDWYQSCDWCYLGPGTPGRASAYPRKPVGFGRRAAPELSVRWSSCSHLSSTETGASIFLVPQALSAFSCEWSQVLFVSYTTGCSSLLASKQ